MAFTANCSIFLSVHDQAINRVLRHIARQRPSLFNYGTQAVADKLELLCKPIDAHPVVISRGNPLITVEPPIPLVGSEGMYAFDFCIQLPSAEVDFSPGDVITLPAQLSPPLAAQRFALHATVCAGLGCPTDDTLTSLPGVRPRISPRDERQPRDDRRPRTVIVIPSRRLECFCVDLFLVGGVEFAGPSGGQHLLGKLFGLEIVDLAPEGMENSIECYLKALIHIVLLPHLSVAAIQLTQDVMGMVSISLSPSPSSAAIPDNPAIEENLLKVFIDMTIGPPSPPAPPGPPGPPGPPPVVGSDRPRSRTGPFDGIAAMSELAVRALFEAVRDEFTFSKADSASFGPFTFSYDVAAHLDNGSIELRDDNTIRMRELDIKWDQLKVCLGINIPERCVGGFCIIPTPFGCALRAPEICVFSANPDISFCLDIGGLITSEISATVSPETKYAVDPARTASMTDWDAQDAGIPNKWQVVLDVVTLDFDLIDIADTVGDLLESALDAAIDGLLGGLPGWAKDLIKAILGPIIDLVRVILDLSDDVGEWIADKLGVMGLFDTILSAIADHLAKLHPLFELEDPFPVLPEGGGLIPVKIPVEFLGVRVNKDELIVEADIGA